jgi:hypothetical protein
MEIEEVQLSDSPESANSPKSVDNPEDLIDSEESDKNYSPENESSDSNDYSCSICDINFGVRFNQNFWLVILHDFFFYN